MCVSSRVWFYRLVPAAGAAAACWARAAASAAASRSSSSISNKNCALRALFDREALRAACLWFICCMHERSPGADALPPLGRFAEGEDEVDDEDAGAAAREDEETEG